MHVCDDSFGHPKGSPSPPLQTGSLLYFRSCSFCCEPLFTLEKHTHRSGVQSDSCGSTFKVIVKPGLVQRATETGTQHTPSSHTSSSYQFSAPHGSISTNEGQATSKNCLKQHSFLPHLLQKSNTFAWTSQNREGWKRTLRS